MCSSIYGEIILIDITQNEFISFFNFNEVECYDENAEVVSMSQCKAKFSIKDNSLTIISSKIPNDGLYCIGSGEFEFKKRKFIRQD